MANEFKVKNGIINQGAMETIVQDSKPSSPNSGYVKAYPKDDGKYYKLESDGTETLIDASTLYAKGKRMTGFFNPEDVIVSYDSTTRKITLTGTVEAYYKGVQLTELENGWVSDAHPTTTEKKYFLIYNGTSFQWLDLEVDTFDFTQLLIANVFYGTSNKFGMRECHGLMSPEDHAIVHELLGTYRTTGGILGDYTINSTTATDRQPSVSSCLIKDEDLSTTLDALSSSGNYTLLALSGESSYSINTTSTDIVNLSGNQPYYNEKSETVWQQTLLPNNNFMNIWLIAFPTSNDTESKSYRFVWQQGQYASSKIEDIRGRTVADLDKAILDALSPEYIYIARVIIKYSGGNWLIAETPEKITGSKVMQGLVSAGGNYLSSIAIDSTLSGLGTIDSPVGLDLSNPNTWTGKQEFSELALNYGTDVATSGQVDDMSSAGKSVFRVTNATSITGIDDGADGRVLILVNITGDDITVSNNSTSSTVSNRILTGTDDDITLSQNGALLLSYDSVAGYWRVIGGVGSESGASYLTTTVEQSSHGFSNDFIYHNGTTWTKAIATSMDTCATHFAKSIDTNNFELISVGEVDVTGLLDDGDGSLTVGEFYQLSQTTDGKIANDLTTGIFQDVLKVNQSNNASIMIGQPYEETEINETLANAVLASQVFG